MELGMGEIVVILLVALLVYGGKLPEVAAAVGRSLAELRRGLRETTDGFRSDFESLADVDPRRAVRKAWQAPRREPALPAAPAAELPHSDAAPDATVAAEPEDGGPPPEPAQTPAERGPD